MGKGQLHLRETAAVKIYPQRHQCKASLFEFAFNFVNLTLVQQQLSFPGRLVVVDARLLVLGDIGSDQETFLAGDSGISAAQVR